MRIHPKHVVLVIAALSLVLLARMLLDTSDSPQQLNRLARDRVRQHGGHGRHDAHAHDGNNNEGGRDAPRSPPDDVSDDDADSGDREKVGRNAPDPEDDGPPPEKVDVEELPPPAIDPDVSRGDGDEEEGGVPQGGGTVEKGLRGSPKDKYKLRLIDRVVDRKRNRGSAPPPKPKKKLIVGIPTVKRPKQSYLLQTLHSLVNGMSSSEKETTVLSVYVSELEDTAFVGEVTESIKREFPNEYASGLIETFGPDLSFYPPLTNLKKKYGDSEMRIKWRCKQVIDYAFMMDRLYDRAEYYLQLEDDVITVGGWVSQVEAFVRLQETCTDSGNSHSPALSCHKHWIMLHYCQLGAIGILFRNEDMPFVAGFYMLTFEEQPVDWLNDRIIEITDQRKPVRLSPSLFQHMGKVSSLPGKIQDLLDYTFRDTSKEQASSNPPATVETSLTPYGGFEPSTPYNKIGGRFWALAPNAGDHYTIKFKDPVHLQRVVFEPCEGLASDVFVHASIEAIIGAGGAGKHSLGTFDRGRLDVRPNLQGVKEIRITAEHPQKTWVCIGKIAINS